MQLEAFLSQLPTKRQMMLFALGYAVGWASAAYMFGPLAKLLGYK